MDFRLNFIFATGILIMVLAANEPCAIGWDANQFMYMLSGVYYFEVLLIII